VEISLKKFLSRFLFDESGVAAIECGLIAAGIAITIITIVGTMGHDLTVKSTEAPDGLKQELR